MGDYKISINAEWNIPDYSANKFDPIGAEIAEKVANDARKNLRNSMGVDGNPLAKLETKTIKNKIAKGSAYPTRPLIDKGIMLNAIHVFKEGVAKYSVGPIARGVPPRDLLAMIHQEIGVGKKRTTRIFLGISNQMSKWIDIRVKRFVAAQERSPKKTKKKYRG